MSIDVDIPEPHVVLITINRPEKRNALDAEHMAALGDAWRRVRDDADVWCAVITGAGDRAFCAGGDLATHIPTFTDTAIAKIASVFLRTREAHSACGTIRLAKISTA